MKPYRQKRVQTSLNLLSWRLGNEFVIFAYLVLQTSPHLHLWLRLKLIFESRDKYQWPFLLAWGECHGALIKCTKCQLGDAEWSEEDRGVSSERRLPLKKIVWQRGYPLISPTPDRPHRVIVASLIHLIESVRHPLHLIYWVVSWHTYSYVSQKKKKQKSSHGHSQKVGQLQRLSGHRKVTGLVPMKTAKDSKLLETLPLLFLVT